MVAIVRLIYTMAGLSVPPEDWWLTDSAVDLDFANSRWFSAVGTVYSETFSSYSSGWQGYTIALVLDHSYFSSMIGTKVRLTLKFNTFPIGSTMKMYITQQAASGDDYDFANTPSHVTFDGSDLTGISNDVGQTFISDWIDLPEAYDNTKNYVVAAYFTSSGSVSVERSDVGDVVGNATWYISGDQAATVDKDGYTLDVDDTAYLISKIEVWGSDTPAVTDVLSCSRASIGYGQNANGTLTQFSSNELRITDLGLLIEDGRTNSLTYSQTFYGTGWTNYYCTPTMNDAIAPDGTQTAAKLKSEVTDSSCYDQHSSLLLANNTPCALSIYAKQGVAGDYLTIGIDDFWRNKAGTVFNLTNGTVETNFQGTGAGGGAVDASWIEALGNGWYRCVTIVRPTQYTDWFFPVVVPDATSTGGWTAAGTGYQYIWGIQLEQNCSFPSSYIPTTTASAARAADVVQGIGALDTMLSGSGASVMVEADRNVPYLNTWYPYFAGADINGYGAFTYQNDTSKLLFNTGPADLEPILGNEKSWTDNIRVGYAQDSNGRSVVAAGGSVLTDGNVLDLSTCYIGYSRFPWWWNDYIRRFTVWSSRLSNATLQALTLPDGESATVLSQTLGTTDIDWRGYTAVLVIDHSLLSSATGTQVRLTLEFYSFAIGGTAKLYMAQQASSGDAYDFANTPSHITFNGSDLTGISDDVNQTFVSDWITLPEAYDNTKNYLIAAYLSGTGSVVPKRTDYDGGVGIDMWDAGGDQAATVDKSDFSLWAGDTAYIISKIEVWEPN